MSILATKNLAVILHTPDIPQNTGNIIRLCANTGVDLHLVKPLGWGHMDDKKLLRAGLDYHEFANVQVHENWLECLKALSGRRIFAIETSGTKYYHEIKFQNNDVLLFGSETRGLPQEILTDLGDNVLRLPMLPTQRSLNLSNSVAIVVYKAWGDLGFVGGI